jgi:glyoxylase-like metal-dependent hydrolase (beta-lactamase superfamily II)
MSSRSFVVGDLQVTAVTDGISKVRPDSFPDANWHEHADLLHEDGTMHLPVACFVVRTGDMTVLIDAGLGSTKLPEYSEVFECGSLPSSLKEAGVSREDIDVVACSHLHLDHAGWLAQDGQPFFPNATVYFGAADWDEFISTAEPHPLAPDYIRAGVRAVEAAGRLEPIERDGQTIAPGITARATPGHTLGHQTFLLSSGTSRLVILGDSIVCPLQIGNPDWSVIAETDQAFARKSRESILKELEGTSTMAIGPHFPGLQVGRVLAGEGKRHFVVN